MTVGKAILPNVTIQINSNYAVDMGGIIIFVLFFFIAFVGSKQQDKTLAIRAENHRMLKQIDAKIEILLQNL